MKLVSFSRESLNVKSSVWSDHLSSKLKYFLLFALCHVFMSQSASAISGCSWSSYSDLDEVTWDPENGAQKRVLSRSIRSLRSTTLET